MGLVKGRDVEGEDMCDPLEMWQGGERGHRKWSAAELGVGVGDWICRRYTLHFKCQNTCNMYLSDM